MLYRVEVAGRTFESADPRALIRLAVQVRIADKTKHSNGLRNAELSKTLKNQISPTVRVRFGLSTGFSKNGE
jgi:hypothetical protein